MRHKDLTPQATKAPVGKKSMAFIVDKLDSGYQFYVQKKDDTGKWVNVESRTPEAFGHVVVNFTDCDDMLREYFGIK